MKRLARAPLFAQVLALVLATALAAQLATFAAVLILPMPHSAFTLDEIARTLRGAPPPDDGRVRLSVEIVNAPPPGWAADDRRERRYRLSLAELMDVSQDNLLVEQQLPFPVQGLLRLEMPKLPESDLPTEPYAGGGSVSFEDAAAAVRLEDGRWIVVSDPPEWLGIGAFLLNWLVISAGVLAALAWMFTRRLVAPIRAFADIAEAAGRGDPDATFPVTGPREVRKAARALAEMQSRLSGAMEERTKLLAAIAHDLRTPLTRLRFRAEYAPAEHRDRIVQDIERMDAMIGGVLAFVRGEERIERKRMDLVALVESVVDDWAASGADVTIVEAAPVQVDADPVALRRLVANILENAVKYAGCARTRVFREGGNAMFVVEDEGPGIAADSLERVFVPFERGDSTRDPATGGVGLGLALARGIARAHGGDVWLSRREGGGLRAHVRIPAAHGSPKPIQSNDLAEVSASTEDI